MSFPQAGGDSTPSDEVHGSTPSPSLSTSHLKRLQTGFLVSAVVLGMGIGGGWYWVAFVVFIFVVGFHELFAMMMSVRINPSRLIVYPMGLILIFLAAISKTRFLLPVVTIGIILAFFRLLFRQPRAHISDIGGTFLALFYTAFLPAHFILLREIGAQGIANPLAQPGMGFLLFTLIVIACSDIGAYYVGKLMGRSLLYPELSPKKTREGAIGGLISGVLVGWIIAYCIEFSFLHATILSILLVGVGQLGDLVESLIKRDAGVKDSGHLLEGHGGLLDRIDSYIFSGAVSYYYIHWFVRKEGLMENVLDLMSHLRDSFFLGLS